MTIPAGAVSRIALQQNHLLKGLDEDAEFSRVFLRNLNDVPGFIRKLFKFGTIKGAYSIILGFSDGENPAPHFDGDMVEFGGFDEFSQIKYPKQYRTVAIPVRRRDRRDSQATVSLDEVRDRQAKKIGRLLVYLFHEWLTQTASGNLHPETDFGNMFGGTGFWASNHSFFGQTLSNVETGNGLSAAAKIDDVYTVELGYGNMPDSNGDPFWGESDEDDGTGSAGGEGGGSELCLIAPKNHRQIVDEVALSALVLGAGATAPSDNYYRKRLGGRIKPHIWNRITSTAYWYFFRVEQGLTPFAFEEYAEGVHMQEWTEQNSDAGRRLTADWKRWIREVVIANRILHCGKRLAV